MHYRLLNPYDHRTIFVPHMVPRRGVQALWRTWQYLLAAYLLATIPLLVRFPLTP